MKFGLQGFVGTVTLLILLLCNGVSASEQSMRQAEALLNAGRFSEAREILLPLESRYIGDPRYDYLIGLVLLETGEPGKAAFALERAIAADPKFAGARLDLARAHFASGAYNDARKELESLRDENPPPSAAKTIEEYLSLIANRQHRLRMEYRLGSRAGYDSNANSATNASSFLGFDLLEQ
ncbi:MAG: tetratricopeptide repeat protein, partial [Gammaproteobacteria bacterium]|nr:tetratricopeptide repeat protein [Gammaproteobacteria bacterium]